MSDTDKIVLTFQRPSLAFKAKPETIKTHNNPKISERRDQIRGLIPGFDPSFRYFFHSLNYLLNFFHFHPHHPHNMR